ncbi:CoA-binding protein [Nocardioides mangrovicus]|uniref:CoA-binding protein n=1 Tax=Nocardioides mangrovicus TaxID=2478913 RepID=A0A3L8P5U5_9ACTN|nr:acetate--CoA ligase family protein [Nocardioides mangrovicus]RLV50770.1 CoA-binding protein [Nocardioides mangrovicus]
MACQESHRFATAGDPVDLSALFDPASIAVVGASADPAKWGHILSRRAVESASSVRRREVALVNRAGVPVLGRATYESLAAAHAGLGTSLELVVVCVPAAALVATVAEAVASGARAIVAITAGLAEMGADGARLEAEAVAVARAGGAVLVGPNCLGVADTGAGLQLGHARLPAGEVTVLSQSGNLVLDLADLLAQRDLGVARFVSLGNQAQLTVVEAMRGCLDHDGTRAVALYVEDVVDGRAFVAAAGELVRAGKPVVLLSPGRSEAAVRSAVSHTGSMTSASQVVDAACVAAGVRRVDDPVRMADLLEGLLGRRRLQGRRVAVVTDGGGHGAVAADALVDAGLEVPLLEPVTRERLRSVLRPSSTTSNPVDLAGAGDRDPTAYALAVTSLLDAADVDGVLLTGWFGGYSSQADGPGELELAAAATIAEAVTAQPKALVVHTVFPDSPTALVLRAAGVPVHRDVRRAAGLLAALSAVDSPGSPDLPAPAAPVSDLGYAAARTLLTEAGLRFPVAREVVDAADIEAAVRQTGFPLVLKALGAVHKSDSGGVVLGLTDLAAARAAYADLVQRLDPPSVSVEAMADLGAGVEVIAGCVRDRTFGPVLLVGLGGVHAEVLADTACALPPVTAARARELLLSLRAAPLLTGVRGRPPVDLDALAEAVGVVSRVAAAHPELVEIEVNPLLALPSGCLALDARLVPR